ncbi:arabinogalactan protein 23 [Gossypium raimondii]|uniref:arabinogalactan protein 23 n=1 Tax=Gossypium raimondii TaxID=29730 RepID=UPI00063AF624|nr:arabinogalactan protein 23 [Gossypium raimondii]
MDMKKVSTAIIVAAASMSAVMAADAPAPSPSAGGSSPSSSPAFAPAAGPDSSVAAATLPVLGSLVGASIVSLFSYILQ